MLESFFARRLSLVFRPDISRVTFLVPYNPVFSRLPMVYEWTNSCFWCWRQLRRKLKWQVTTTIMSCRLRRLRPWKVCLMFVEILMRYNRHNRPIEVKGSPVQRVGRRCCTRIIEARMAPVLWARETSTPGSGDHHVLWNPRLKKSETNAKKGDYTCLHFFVMRAFWPAVCMFVCCIYWLVVMVWVYCCYRTCQRRVSCISLY